VLKSIQRLTGDPCVIPHFRSFVMPHFCGLLTVRPHAVPRLPVFGSLQGIRIAWAKELAWRRGDVPEAAAAIAAAGKATLGGEVWLVRDLQANWSGLIPNSDGSPDGVWSWDTSSRGANESWQAYCDRTCQETIAAVAAMQVEHAAAASVQSLLWFNFTYVAEDEA
jgi:hypothetical protein